MALRLAPFCLQMLHGCPGRSSQMLLDFLMWGSTDTTYMFKVLSSGRRGWPVLLQRAWAMLSGVEKRSIHSWTSRWASWNFFLMITLSNKFYLSYPFPLKPRSLGYHRVTSLNTPHCQVPTRGCDASSEKLPKEFHPHGDQPYFNCHCN